MHTLTFEPMYKIILYGVTIQIKATEKYFTLVFSYIVYKLYKDGSYFWDCGQNPIWCPFKWNLHDHGSSFLWLYILHWAKYCSPKFWLCLWNPLPCLLIQIKHLWQYFRLVHVLFLNSLQTKIWDLPEIWINDRENG